MTQIHIYSAFLILWAAFTTRMFIRDNAPALEAEKQLQARDGR